MRIRRQVMEIAAVVPALRDDFTVEPIFVRDAIGAPAALDGCAAARRWRRGSSGCATPGAARRPRRREERRRDARSPRSRSACSACSSPASLVGQPVELRRWRASPATGADAHSSGSRRPAPRCRPRQFVVGSLGGRGRSRSSSTCVVTGTALVALVPAAVAARAPARVLRPPARRAPPRAAGGVARRSPRRRRLDRRRALAHPRARRAGRHRARRRSATRSPASRLLARMLGTGRRARGREGGARRPDQRPRHRGARSSRTSAAGRSSREILDDLVVATTKDVKVLDEIESEGLEMKINARRGARDAVVRARRADAPRRRVPRLLPVAGRTRSSCSSARC